MDEKKNFIMSYSCGKDSTLALYRMIKWGHTPKALLITLNKENESSWFHDVSLNLVEEVSKALGIKLLVSYSKGDDYETSFKDALLEGKKLGATACVFGDIDIENHKKWCNDRCNETNMESIFPLWQENREELTYEFINSEFKALVKKVNLNNLSEDFLGKILTKELVKKIKETGSDPCGENGEYHTFVFDGPIFKTAVNFKKGEIYKSYNCGILDLKGESENE